MGNAKSKFIKPMLAVLPAPKTDDLQTYVEVYDRMLAEFDDDVLEMAADHLLRTIKVKTMPVPADCIDACKEAKKTIDLRQMRATRPQRKIREQFTWTAEMAAHADKLFASDWGRRACADGVEIAVWDFMVRHQRWPNEVEYERVREKSIATQEATKQRQNELQDGSGKIQDFLGFQSTMKRKRDRLNELVKAG